MKVLVVYGGQGISEEVEVSLKTGSMILTALRNLPGIEALEYILSKDNLAELKPAMEDVDLVWPATHGRFGEDGEFQSICEAAGVKFVGSDAQSSRLCFDKVAFKKKLQEWSILTPGSQVMEYGDETTLTFPVCLKPIDSGSSIDTFKLNSVNELQDKLKALTNKYPKMLVEEWITGMECTVAVLGTEALPMIEIIPPESAGFFDLISKYDGSTQELCPPQNISKEWQAKGMAMALSIHQKAGCRHLSRTDMILRDDKLYVLETNTLPGMTQESLLPKTAKAGGYDFIALVSRIIELAVA